MKRNTIHRENNNKVLSVGVNIIKIYDKSLQLLKFNF